MATIRAQVVKLGIFLAAVVAVLVLSLVLIGGLRMRPRATTYHIVTTRTVAGIEVGSTVTMLGVEIGRVAAIELDRSDFGRVRIDLAIDPDIELPAGSEAHFQRVGVAGQRIIDLAGGTLASGRLEPGSPIPHGQTPLEAIESRGLDDELSSLVADARQTVAHAKGIVTAVDPKRVAALAEAVDPARLEAILVRAEHTMETLESTSEALERAVTKGGTRVEDTTHELEAVAERASTVLEHADGAVADLSRVLSLATDIMSANEDDIRVAVGNLRRTSQDARALARVLRARPSLLMRAAPPKERERP